MTEKERERWERRRKTETLGDRGAVLQGEEGRPKGNERGRERGSLLDDG